MGRPKAKAAKDPMDLIKTSPIGAMLTRLQKSAGWTEFVDDRLKARVIKRLAWILDDDETPPQVQIAAGACLIRCSQVENETIGVMCRMLETSQMSERLAEVEKRLDQSQETNSDFIEIDVLADHYAQHPPQIKTKP